MNKLIIILSLLLLSSCNFAHTLATGGAAGTGALIGGAVGGPAVGAITAGAATVAVEVLSPAITEQVKVETIAGSDGINTFPELLAFAWVKFESYIWYLIYGSIALFLITGWLGFRIKRPEEKRAEKQVQELLEKLIEKK